MTNDNFEERVLADMHVALERACENLSIIHGDHPVRRFVAERLIEAANAGYSTLTELTAIAKKALIEYKTKT
jgi:hypothetical protein